ncbi:MAG: hypothetical protein Q9160_003300 [Pyrenula sp. 1 TL-2023]
MQSPASWSSKDSGREEGACSDKRPPTASLPADCHVDENEIGTRLVAESPAAGFADIPPSNDLPCLTEFSPQASDLDGDNIFDLSLSPSPFFSSVLSSMHPEPTQSEAARMSRDLLPPSLSLGDEMPYAASLAKELQESPLFEIGPDATPTSLPTSALVSTLLPSQSSSGQSCQCLAVVVFAVEEFEAKCNSGNRAELDTIIASQKGAIRCCRLMLECRRCLLKRENLVLLVFMTERIVTACERIVLLYRMKDNHIGTDSVPSPLPDCLPNDCLLHCVNVVDRDLATSASPSSPNVDYTQPSPITSAGPGTSPDWQELLLGDYEISSPLEWERLVRVLISLQLKAVTELSADIKIMGSRFLGDTQAASLAQVEMRLGQLEKGICIC